MKEETIKEAAETNSEKHHYSFGRQSEFYQLGFIEGVKWKEGRNYSEEDMKQFAFECVANFLSNNDNKVEIKLVDAIIDRNNLQFEKFKNKQI